MKKLLTISFLIVLSFCSQAQLDTSLVSALQYRNIGPFRGGRSCTVTGVPGEPNLFYFGSTGGGIWKTENGGKTWQNISDGYFGGSIGAVAVAPSDHNVIYVGGGEKTVRGNVSYGYGVWKSEDAGETWTNIGLPESRHIGRIRIHPENSDIAYVAVMGDLYKSTEERGVYKTTNGGQSWEKILFANADAGAVDLMIDPHNPRVLYASTWRIRRTPYSLSSGGNGSGLWKSTDEGRTWKNISDAKGLPTDTIGIIGIAVSPVKRDRVWAIIESKSGGVFRSDNGGKTWSKLNDSRSLRQRAWYYTRIYADTQNPDGVYVMNVRYHKSTDGGKTFTANVAPHGDHHDLWIAPEDPKRMIIGDDGGAQVSFDGGISWSTYQNQPTAQFYRVFTDNHEPYRIYASQQDNSTIRIYHRTPGFSIGENDWESTAGCECGFLAPDPEDPEIVYGGCYDGVIERQNHRLRQSRGVNVWPNNPMGHGVENMKYRFQWNFPIFFSPHDPNKLYTASNHLHVSMNEGQSWETISPDLTRNDPEKQKSSGGPITQDNTSVEYYCTIFAAAESPRVPGLLWVGSDDGLVHVSRDGGENWTDVTPPGMPEWIMINNIEPDPHNDGGCYFAGTMYKSGDYQPYLFKTKDYGKTWTKIVNGIEKDHFTRVVRADPNQQGILYAGTETGMYISIDDGANWTSFQMNLPVVPITDLTIKNNDLIVATQGRSLWMIDDLTMLYEYDEMDDDLHLFSPEPSIRMNGGGRSGSLTTGENHPGGVMVYYHIQELQDTTEVILSFYDDQGELIEEYSNQNKKENKLDVSAGSNQFSWDMRYPDAKDFDGMIFWAGSLNGPKALPGDYSVKLSVDGMIREKSFEIISNPNSESTEDELRAGFEFAQSVNSKVTEAHEAIENIRTVRAQIKELTGRLPGDENVDSLTSLAKHITKGLTAVEEALYQTKNRSRQDPLNFPIRLTNKLAHLNSMMRSGEYPPTEQQVGVRDELTTLIDAELEKYQDIMDNDLETFNQLYKQLDLDIILLKE